MKFFIRRSSAENTPIEEQELPCDSAVREGDDWSIEVSTLEELLALSCLADRGVIVSRLKDGRYTLEIYDAWRE